MGIDWVIKSVKWTFHAMINILYYQHQPILFCGVFRGHSMLVKNVECVNRSHTSEAMLVLHTLLSNKCPVYSIHLLYSNCSSCYVVMWRIHVLWSDCILSTSHYGRLVVVDNTRYCVVAKLYTNLVMHILVTGTQHIPWCPCVYGCCEVDNVYCDTLYLIWYAPWCPCVCVIVVR